MSTPRYTFSKRLIVLNAVGNTATRLINVGITVWFIQFLLKRISPAEYQLLPVIASIIALAPLVTTMFTSGLARFVTEANARGEASRITAIASTMTVVLWPLAAVLAAVGGAMAFGIGTIVDIPAGRLQEARLMLLLLLMPLVANVMAVPFSTGLYATQRFRTLNVIDLSSTLLQSLVLVALLVGVGPQVVWVVVAKAGGSLARTAAILFFSKRELRALRFRPGHIDFSIARQIFGFSVWTSIGAVLTYVRDSADPLILNRLADPVAVTAFNVGSTLVRQIRVLTTHASVVVTPVLTGLHATDAHNKLRNAYLRGGRYVSWFSLSIITFVAVFRHELLAVYLGMTANLYRDAAAVILLLAISTFVHYPNSMLWKLSVAKNRIKALTIWMVLQAGVNLALTFYLVGGRGWGALGSAAATAITGTTWTVLVYWPLGLAMAGVPFGRFRREALLPGLAPAAGAAIAWEIARRVFDSSSVPGLAAAAVPGFLLYVVALIACSQPQDRLEAQRMFSRIRRSARASTAVEREHHDR